MHFGFVHITLLPVCMHTTVHLGLLSDFSCRHSWLPVPNVKDWHGLFTLVPTVSMPCGWLLEHVFSNT